MNSADIAAKYQKTYFMPPEVQAWFDFVLGEEGQHYQAPHLVQR